MELYNLVRKSPAPADITAEIMLGKDIDANIAKLTGPELLDIWDQLLTARMNVGPGDPHWHVWNDALNEHVTLAYIKMQTAQDTYEWPSTYTGDRFRENIPLSAYDPVAAARGMIPVTLAEIDKPKVHQLTAENSNTQSKSEIKRLDTLKTPVFSVSDLRKKKRK